MYMQVHGQRRRDGARKGSLDVRIIRRAARILVSLAYGSCLAAIAVPPPVVVAAAPALGQSVGAAADISAIQAEFAAIAEPLGLQVLGEPQVERLDTNLSAVTTTATVPLDQRTTSTFFLRRTQVIAERADLPNQVIARSDLRIDYVGIHVTLEFVDRFMPALDAFAGRTTGLAGKEIRRRAEFDSPGLEAYVAARAEEPRSLLPNARHPLSSSTSTAQIEAQNYVETATIVLPDGTARTYPAGTLDLATILGGPDGTGGAAALTYRCVEGCFNASGFQIALGTVLCIVAGAAACGVVCGLTAGVACIPCITGIVLEACGLAAIALPIVICIVHCINPNFEPPPSPTPTATPTPAPCVGDCADDAAVTVDELLMMVNIAVGNMAMSECENGDGNDDGLITVDEILMAVNNALNGCSFSPAEQGCLTSGGSVSTAMCCAATGDFPDTCGIGACGCPPDASHDVRVCDCGSARCFDGSACVTQ